jgi:hypothetical protein
VSKEIVMKKQILTVFVVAALAASFDADAGVVQEQQAQIDDLIERVEDLEAANGALQALLAGVSRSNDTLLFEGMNLQIVNGLGATDGDTGDGPEVNGLGNLVVGYDEVRGCGGAICPANKYGSHNLVIGADNMYTSYGSLVVGENNSAFAPYASVVGGYFNDATGWYSTVVGSAGNVAEGNWSSVLGAYTGTASGIHSTAVGGDDASASGGFSTVLGGNHNVASGTFSTVTGGYWNEASGNGASVSGGESRTAAGTSDWAAGSLWEDQ